MSPVRRALAVLIAVACLAAGLLVMTSTTASSAISVDPRLSQLDCRLTGRVYVAGRGCARIRCLPGSTMFKAGKDAELCQKRGPKGAEWARPISSERCAELGRIWVGEVNSCASNGDRARTVVPDARQCATPGATYVNHSEEEGYYDECISAAKARELRRIARDEGASLNKVALERGRANCSYRPGYVIAAAVCVQRQGPPTTDLGGFYMVGDSVSWRADNELDARKDWLFDLRPGRRLDELPGRLDWFRANHGDPDQLIVQLGTNRRQGYNEDDFRDTMATVPADVPVMFLLPYRDFNGTNEGPVRATHKYSKWMSRLAEDRPLTCLADWPKYAAKHLDRLVDGEHPGARSEDWYARYVIRQWDRCASALGV